MKRVCCLMIWACLLIPSSAYAIDEFINDKDNQLYMIGGFATHDIVYDQFSRRTTLNPAVKLLLSITAVALISVTVDTLATNAGCKGLGACVKTNHMGSAGIGVGLNIGWKILMGEID